MSETETPDSPAERGTGRLARWTPTLLGLAFVGLGLGAIGFAQSGLEIRVPEAPSSAPDPIALLRDDVGTLQGDLASLRKGLGTNLEALANGLDGAAEERYQAQTKTLAALEKRLVGLEAQIAAAARQAQDERRALGTSGVKGSPGSEPATPSGEAPAAAQGSEGGTPPAEPASGGPLAKAPTEPAPAPAEPAEPAPEPAPARKRGLFSFKLTGGLDFAQRQRYEVIASLSRVGFDAKSTLHDFSGVTTEVAGYFAGRLDQTGALEGRVAAKVAAIKTGVDGRDEEMRKVLEAEAHPELVFVLERLEVKTSDLEAKTASAIVHGSFTIKGVTKTLAVPLEISVDRSRRLVVAGELKFLLSEFGIEPPSVAGAIKVEDGVKLWLSLRLRSMGAVEETK